MKDKIEIPFGAHDSELKGWEYTIPEGFTAEIKDGKVIVREKANEDERIRKYLIEELKAAKSVGELKFTIPQPTREKCIAYLERQKEQKPVDFPTTDEEVNEFLETHPKVEVPEKYKTPDFVFSKQEYESHPIISKDTTSVRPAEWSEKDEALLKEIIAFFKDGTVKLQHDLDLYASFLEHRLKSLRPQPKREWSEEDEKRIQSILFSIGYCKDEYPNKKDYLKDIAWLKALPLSLKKRNEDVAKLCSNEWSEKDKAMLKVAIAVLRRYSHDDVANWLKSLRPSWKPSEEQMQCLLAVITNQYNAGAESCHLTLGSLYNDLKKLI